MNILNWKGFAAAALAGLLIGAAGAGFVAWNWQANTYEAQLAEVKQEKADQATRYETTLRGVATAATQAAEAALKRQQDDAATIAALDERLTKEKNDAERREADLRAAVADGNQRLRIAIKRADASAAAAGSGQLPQAPGAAGVDDAATAELAGSSVAAYFDLRKSIIDAESALTGLQEYVRNTCLK